MDKDILLDVVIDRLSELKDNLKDMYATVAALEKTVEHFSSEEEEPTIEDEIMSALKDVIDEKSFKNVSVKVVKVDEKDD